LDLGERRFGEKYFVIAAGIGLRAVALGDFLKCFGVVFPRRPHTDGKRAQHGPRRQRWFTSRDRRHNNASYVLAQVFLNKTLMPEVTAFFNSLMRNAR
jgi:hypothetical protein